VSFNKTIDDFSFRWTLIYQPPWKWCSPQLLVSVNITSSGLINHSVHLMKSH